MPKVAKGRRKRAYAPKTRTGCLTCKVRRVKCDETRPHCLRCTTTRRVCDGYPHVSCVDPSDLCISPLASSPDISANIHPCSLSRRSFAFFIQKSSPQLAGVFGSAFWERLVLQAAHYEPAIRHAITAIGSLHEQHIIGGHTEVSFALQQYNLAIKSLLAPPAPGQQRGLDVSLISCLLFTCFENMQGHHAIAESHIHSGSKLLQGIVHDQKTGALQNQTPPWMRQVDCYVQLENLIAIFAVLDNEAAKIMRDLRSSTYDMYLAAIMNNGAHFEFSSIEEARNIFEYCLYSFTSGDPVRPLSDTEPSTEFLRGQVDFFTKLITEFSTAMRTFMDTRRPFLTPREKVSADELQLHVLNSYVTFSVEYLPPACRPHSSTLSSKMEEMLSLCENIIAFISDGTDSVYRQTSFCLDIGYVIPLYTVASQCHDMTIRRRAIDLLRSTPRQEGLWNSLVVAKAAERILEIEESRGEQLTSPSTRIISQVDSMGVRLQYSKSGPDTELPVSVVEEVATW